jgi:hypothetical protein
MEGRLSAPGPPMTSKPRLSSAGEMKPAVLSPVGKQGVARKSSFSLYQEIAASKSGTRKAHVIGLG